jgi:hypothetical protein
MNFWKSLPQASVRDSKPMKCPLLGNIPPKQWFRKGTALRGRCSGAKSVTKSERERHSARLLLSHIQLFFGELL